MASTFCVVVWTSLAEPRNSTDEKKKEHLSHSSFTPASSRRNGIASEFFRWSAIDFLVIKVSSI